MRDTSLITRNYEGVVITLTTLDASIAQFQQLSHLEILDPVLAQFQQLSLLDPQQCKCQIKH